MQQCLENALLDKKYSGVEKEKELLLESLMFNN